MLTGLVVFTGVTAVATAASATTTLITVCRLTGGSNQCLRYLSVKEEPSKLRIIDEYVSVALDTLNNLVTAHFPGINRVKCTPFKKNVNALEYFGNAVSTPSSAPSYVNVKTNSCNVTLNVVKGLKVCTVIVTAKITGCGIATVLCSTAIGVTVLFVTASAVYNSIGGTNVMKVGTATRGVTAAKALRPNVFSVPTVPLTLSSRIRGINKKNCAVLILTVGLVCLIVAVVICGNILVLQGSNLRQ